MKIRDLAQESLQSAPPAHSRERGNPDLQHEAQEDLDARLRGHERRGLSLTTSASSRNILTLLSRFDFLATRRGRPNQKGFQVASGVNFR